LILSEDCQEGYKPVVFAEIPDTFDQTTQCAFQGEFVDKGEYIEVDVLIKEAENQDDGMEDYEY